MKEWFIAVMLFTLPVIGCAKAIDPGPLPATAGHASALTVGEAGSLQANGGSAGNVESDDDVTPSAGAPGVTVTVIIDDGEDGGAETVPPATGGSGSNDPSVDVSVNVNIDNTNNTGVGGGTSNPDNDEEGGAPVDSSTGGSEPGYGGATATGGWEDPGTDPNNGGSVESGGADPTGGVYATGGQEATGGTIPVSTGGVATGGTETGGISTGGTAATGGTDETGGTEPSTGGNEATGGTETGGTTPTPDPVVGPSVEHQLPTNNRLVNGSRSEIYCFTISGAPRRFIQLVVKTMLTNAQLANYRFSRNGQFFGEDEVSIYGSDGVDLVAATVASDGIAIVSLSASEPTDGTTRYCVSAVPNSGPGGIVNTRMSDTTVTSVTGALDSVDDVWSVDGEVGPVLWTDDIQFEEEWWNYGITMPLGSTTLMY